MATESPSSNTPNNGKHINISQLPARRLGILHSDEMKKISESDSLQMRKNKSFNSINKSETETEIKRSRSFEGFEDFASPSQRSLNLDQSFNADVDPKDKDKIKETAQEQKIRESLISRSLTRMRTNFNAVTAWLFGWLFSVYSIEQNDVIQLQKAAKRGPLVYVIRTQSWLMYLLLNFLFIKYHLPLSQYAHGLFWLPIQSIFTQLRIFLGWITLDKSLFIQMLNNDLSVLVCLAHSDSDDETIIFSDIINFQRRHIKPIHVCPLHVVWDRSPTRKGGYWERVFGSQEKPGGVREVYQFFKDRRQCYVRVAGVINLQEFLRKHASGTELVLHKNVCQALDREHRVVTGPVLRPHDEVADIILSTSAVQDALGREDIVGDEERARKLLREISADYGILTVRMMSFFVSKIFKRIYDGIHVEERGISRIRAASLKGPVVLIPTHKSHIDYLLLSYVFFMVDLSLPYTAAGENLNIPFFGPILRQCGAFFMRRVFGDDKLYKSLFAEYTKFLLNEGATVNFFIEGGRSRNGILRPPKTGLLSFVVDAFLKQQQDGAIPDIYFVPTYIGYDFVVEGESYTSELLGHRKSAESVSGVLQARRILKRKFGHVVIKFATPISLKEYINDKLKAKLGRTEPISSLPLSSTSATTSSSLHSSNSLSSVSSTISPSPTLTTSNSISSIPATSTTTFSSPSSSTSQNSALSTYMSSRDEMRKLIMSLAHRLVYEIYQITVAMPTDLVSTILLTHPTRGISKQDLMERVMWLRNEIMARGGQVSPMEDLEAVVNETVTVLAQLLKIPSNTTEELYRPKNKRRLQLSYYRNQIVHYFVSESIVSLSLCSLLTHNVKSTKSSLLDATLFLSRLLKMEFSFKSESSASDNFEQTLTRMFERSILQSTNDEITVVPQKGDTMVFFLCAMIWPVIDSYWVSALSLVYLLSHGGQWFSEEFLLQRMQTIAETLYHEGHLFYCEAVSMDTLKNTLNLLEGLNILERRVMTVEKKKEFQLSESYQDEKTLKDFIERIGSFRKEPIGSNSLELKALVGLD